jgi:F-type H+-transporting ATPase subunit gamma
MANLKEVRIRIESVKSTMQITSAMKMVSASKLRRAQNAIQDMRPYAQKLGDVLASLTSSLSGDESPFAQERGVGTVLIVAINSNRGLCGGFNSSVVKRTKVLIKEHSDKKVEVLGIGKKSREAFKNTDHATGTEEGLDHLYDDLSFANVSKVADMIMERYTSEEVDKVILVYNRFKNAAVQILQTEGYLPVPQPEQSEESTHSIDFILEPSREEIIKEIIPSSLRVQLFKALLDSHASEHGARMTAMHKATDNADDILKELKLSYNKARQAAITGEILEIVGGAEALNN